MRLNWSIDDWCYCYFSSSLKNIKINNILLYLTFYKYK